MNSSTVEDVGTSLYMKIYTKTGDFGETGLLNGVRVAKDDLRISSYGTLDELNAAIGLGAATWNTLETSSIEALKIPLEEQFRRIQRTLFSLGSELAGWKQTKDNRALISHIHIEELENWIDEVQAKMPELKDFVLPGGTIFSAQMHLARTIARRAERLMTTLQREQGFRGELLQYINRLSDYLFSISRYGNYVLKVSDELWKQSS